MLHIKDMFEHIIYDNDIKRFFAKFLSARGIQKIAMYQMNLFGFIFRIGKR